MRSALTSLHQRKSSRGAAILLALVIMVICVMTGRVVPMFTKNVTPGLVINVSRRFELTLLTVTAATLALWVLGAPAPLVGVLSAVAAVLHAARLWQWHPRVTLKRPILWILHASYAWMPMGFALLALACVPVVWLSLAVTARGFNSRLQCQRHKIGIAGCYIHLKLDSSQMSSSSLRARDPTLTSSHPNIEQGAHHLIGGFDHLNRRLTTLFSNH